MLNLVDQEGEEESDNCSGHIDTEEDNNGGDPDLGPLDNSKLSSKKKEEHSLHGNCHSGNQTVGVLSNQGRNVLKSVSFLT